MPRVISLAVRQAIYQRHLKAEETATLAADYRAGSYGRQFHTKAGAFPPVREVFDILGAPKSSGFSRLTSYPRTLGRASEVIPVHMVAPSTYTWSRLVTEIRRSRTYCWSRKPILPYISTDSGWQHFRGKRG